MAVSTGALLGYVHRYTMPPLSAMLPSGGLVRIAIRSHVYDIWQMHSRVLPSSSTPRFMGSSTTTVRRVLIPMRWHDLLTGRALTWPS